MTCRLDIVIHQSPSIVATLSIAAWLFGAAAISMPAQTQQRFHQVHKAMGTEFTIDLYADSEATANPIIASAFEEIDRIEALLSNYQPGSELSRISREAGVAPVTTDPETYQFLERSLYWSQRSGGAFDVTVGPLLRAWGFYFHEGRVPSSAELAELREKVGWRNVEIDSRTRTVRFLNHKPMELDPGSIGKGFAVDRVVALLRQQGITSAFISAGGSTLYAIGVIPGSAGWPVVIPDPRESGRKPITIELKDTSLSTGACTEKFFIKNGHRYCHIFNPLTMRPVEGVLQTTVIDPSATDSDALSTVVFVLVPEASTKLVATMPSTQALIFRSEPASSCTAIHWPGNPCGPALSTLKESQP